MKTFDDFKKELKLVCEYKLEKIANEIPTRTDYFVAVKKELQNIINDPELLNIKTMERISNRIQAVLDMANGGKSIGDIMKLNLLGITEQDYDIVEKINTCIHNPNISIFTEDLKNTLLQHYNIQKELSESDSRSM